VKIALQIKLNRFFQDDKIGLSENRSTKSCRACKYTLWPSFYFRFRFGIRALSSEICICSFTLVSA